MTLKLDDSALPAKVAAMGESKKAMPFVQGLKRRLATEPPETVFERRLVFDEVDTVKNAVASIARMTGAVEVRVIVVSEGAAGKGRRVDTKTEEIVDVPGLAEGAEPGNPKFEFENV